MQYYLITDQGEEGPFDLLALVRKAKNGALMPESMVRVDGEKTTAPASKTPGVADLFADLDEEDDVTASAHNVRQYDVKKLFLEGWEFVTAHQTTVIMTGLFMVIALIGGVICSNVPLVGIALTFTFLFVMFSCYIFLIAKKTRGQAFHLVDILPVLQRSLVPLVLAGLVLSIPVIVGLILLLVPGLFVITFYLFTPMLIMEQKRSFWEAMEMSRKKVMSMGSHNIGVLFSLVVANFVAIICFLFPLLITLPLTMSELSEIYDDQFPPR